MRIGARVRLTTIGTVVQDACFGSFGNFGSHVEIMRESDGLRNIAMLDDAQLEEVDANGSVPDRGWRDVCADMIRLGNDTDAIGLLREHSPDAIIIVTSILERQRLLEDVFSQASKLFALGRPDEDREVIFRRLYKAVLRVRAHRQEGEE